MTTRQESKLSMFLAVKDYLTANATLTTALPNYAGFFSTFQSSIISIQTYGEQQMFDKTGIAENKKALRETLVMLAADTSRKITAYAKFANNTVLMNEIKYTESDLKKLADTGLRDATQGVYDRAQTNLTALATYGITAATQTTYLNAINAFVASIPKPRLGITDKKQSTTQLANFFNVAEGALENIDTIIEIVKLTQPNFYNGYKSARKLVETGTGSLTVNGFITDASTGEPLKGVTVSFSPDGGSLAMKAVSSTNKTTKTDPLVVKKTAEKGGFNIKSLPEGTYQVSVKKNGYLEQIVTIEVTSGEKSEVKVQLEKK